MRRMSTRIRVVAAVVGVALWLLVFGFVIFAASVMRDPPDVHANADGIVVLTGGDQRIAEGARLLEEGRGERLLISGVNPKTRRDEVMKFSQLDTKRFDCCVDLGYGAVDTISNADETRIWAEQRRYDSLIVVTSNYHMPRTLVELERALPKTEFIPHPVVPRHFRLEAWWLDPGTTRVLIGEYLKLLPATARLGVSMMLRPWNGSSVAAARPEHRAEASK